MTATCTTAADMSHPLLAAITSGDLPALLERCADNVVFEFPFAPAGRPRRLEGWPEVGRYLAPIFANSRVERLVERTVHQSVDPFVATIEYTVALRRSQTSVVEVSYVVILEVRDGLVARYRDYWNPLAFTEGSQ